MATITFKDVHSSDRHFCRCNITFDRKTITHLPKILEQRSAERVGLDHAGWQLSVFAPVNENIKIRFAWIWAWKAVDVLQEESCNLKFLTFRWTNAKNALKLKKHAESKRDKTWGCYTSGLVELGLAGLSWAGLGWAGLGREEMTALWWAGLSWAWLGWAGLGWAGLGCAALNAALGEAVAMCCAELGWASCAELSWCSWSQLPWARGTNRHQNKFPWMQVRTLYSVSSILKIDEQMYNWAMAVAQFQSYAVTAGRTAASKNALEAPGTTFVPCHSVMAARPFFVLLFLCFCSIPTILNSFSFFVHFQILSRFLIFSKISFEVLYLFLFVFLHIFDLSPFADFALFLRF